LFSILALVALIFIVVVGGGYMLSAPRYHGPATDHFVDGRFVDQPPAQHHGFGDMMKFFRTKSGPWRDWTENNDYPPPPARVGMGDLHVTFVNHSTLLIQMDSLNILTDPIWSERCAPFSWIGPKRHRAPGVKFDDLPDIDFVLISHNHYDHCDIPTLKRLASKFHPRFITGLGNDLLLKKNGIDNVTAIDWGDSVRLSEDVMLHGVPARHFSNRGMFDRNATLWMGFVLEAPHGNVYFAGDTGFGPHFAEIAAEFSPIRLAALPIGAYEPSWFMKDVHINPAEAVKACEILGAETAVGIHFGTFKLASDGQDQPITDLHAALDSSDVDNSRFWVLDFGEGRNVPVMAAVAR
jgi:L-ascorbate metabolism protein UlaG (beta-lactamase superfamily)